MRRSSPTTVLLLAVALLLVTLPAPAASPSTGASWSPGALWTWAERPLPSTSGPDQTTQAVITGTTTAKRNGGFVLRRAANGDRALVSFSGTRYQVRTVVGGRETLLVDRPFRPTGTGPARAELRGSTLTASWAGTTAGTDTLPALGRLTGRGTGLLVWQDRAVVTFDRATASGPAPSQPVPAPTPSPTPSPTTSPAPAQTEGVTWSSPTAWRWVQHAMPATTTPDQYAEAAVHGATTAGRNGAFVLRRDGAGDHALVSFSGTRYQVRTVVGGKETLLLDEPFTPTAVGAARVQLRGDRLTAHWGGALVSERTLSGLGRLDGTGTGLALWQDAPSAVTIAHAVTGTLDAAPTPAPTAPAVWASGASGDGVADGSFGTWRGRTVDIAGTWNDNWESQPYQWSLRPGFEFGDWQQDLDVAVGGIYKTRGESWAAAASGAYDARWRQSLTNLDSAWGDRPGTLYIRFAHEFNGDWYPWSVTAAEASDFVAAWRRFRAIQLEVAPDHELVFCPNVETSTGLGLDWRTAFPGREHVDVMSVDVYNQYPFARTVEEFDAVAVRVDPRGAPAGLESHRAFAGSVGLPFAISEWASNGEMGDSPVFVAELHRWLARHGGSGPGQVLYEVYFNVGSYGGGQFQLHPATRQPQARTEYARLW